MALVEGMLGSRVNRRQAGGLIDTHPEQLGALEAVEILGFGEEFVIHTFKPLACRQWSASPYRTECRQGLQQYWGLSIDDEGKIAGPIESLKSFQLFLEMLK